MQKQTTGNLKHGFSFKEKLHFDFEMRAVATAGQLFDAEIEAGGVENTLAFNGAVLAGQLIRIGDCPGPFGLEQIRTLHPDDYNILRKAQQELMKEPDPKLQGSIEGSGNQQP